MAEERRQRGTPFTAEQVADMVSRYEAGETNRAIGKVYGCGRDRVAQVIKSEGVYRGRERFRALNESQKQEALRRYGAGESARSISLSMGCKSAKPVEALLKAEGVYRPRLFEGFTSEEEDDLVSRYGARESVESLARAYDCQRGPVVTILKRRGVYRAQRYQGFTPAERDEVVARYRDGATPAALAREFSCAHDTIDRMLQRLGEWKAPTAIERVGARFTMDQKREMVARYESGDSIYKIAKEFDGIPQSIWSILRAAGVEFRDKAWRGGRVVASGGYTAVTADPDDPIASSMATVTGYVLEHRLVVAKSLGRPLTRHETVHHINGDKRDNRLENLQLRNGNHGKGVRLACLDCGSHNVAAVPLAP
jgi:transposase-like protein